MLHYDKFRVLTFDCYGTLIDWETGILSAVKTLLSRAGVEVGDELESFSRSVGSWPAFEDSSGALRRLKKKYGLAILSNVDRDLFALSAQTLGVDFDYIFTAEDIGSYKPSRRNFQYALDRLPEGPDRVLHVAQSLYHDIGPAGELGLQTVWINRRHGKKGGGATPDADVTPHAEFPDLGSFATMACGYIGHEL